MDHKIKSLNLANLLRKNHSKILSLWKNQPHLIEVLNSRQICVEFFIKHFGSRVLDYFIGVLEEEKSPGQCPVIIVMLKFFSNHGLKLEEIFRICSGMRNAVIHTVLENGISHTDKKFMIVADLFDTNFAGVICEYLDMQCKQEHIEAPSYCHLSTPLLQSPIIGMHEKESTFDNALIEEYFTADEEEEDKIVFRTDDADDLIEYFSEINERLAIAGMQTDYSEIKSVANIFNKTSSILLHYSPYLDSLAASMSELSNAMLEHSESFMEVLKNSNEALLKLFDAVSSDMDRYIERFSVENIAMKNAHHIHEPTTLSIRQIIGTFAPEHLDESEIEFF